LSLSELSLLDNLEIYDVSEDNWWLPCLLIDNCNTVLYGQTLTGEMFKMRVLRFSQRCSWRFCAWIL